MDNRANYACGFVMGTTISRRTVWTSTPSELTKCAKKHTHSCARPWTFAPRMIDTAGEALSKKEMRRKILGSDKFNRMGFKETKAAAAGMMTEEFTSDLVRELREQAYTMEQDGITIRLARAYGFCWGVERAVAMAYETRKQFPGKRIWITNEIIHNPTVNLRMNEMNMFFVPQDGFKKDLTGIESGDVVILPAFGATLEEMQYLHSKQCQIVDTTCPWVSKVWSTLDKHRKAQCTSIIHGKWWHEETVATASFAENYLVVLNVDEAEYVASYIMHGGDKKEFQDKFKNAMSENFDPDKDLHSVGIANQTTMLKSETTAIGKLFEKTMMKKFGPENLNSHFVAYDTICDATQERQDAMKELLAEPGKLDLMIVIGGFNSSNTHHLQEIAEHAGVKSFWVNSPACVGPGNRILYRTSDGVEQTVENWLPSGPVSIGITSGASTPDNVLQDVIERVFMIRKLQPVPV